MVVTYTISGTASVSVQIFFCKFRTCVFRVHNYVLGYTYSHLFIITFIADFKIYMTIRSFLKMLKRYNKVVSPGHFQTEKIKIKHLKGKPHRTFLLNFKDQRTGQSSMSTGSGHETPESEMKNTLSQIKTRAWIFLYQFPKSRFPQCNARRASDIWMCRGLCYRTETLNLGDWIFNIETVHLLH